MDKKDIPVGFAFTLALNNKALSAFSAMNREEQARIIEQSQSVKSKAEMTALVSSIAPTSTE